MDERQILRELAKRQRELAESPENKALEVLWYEHNALKGSSPMVVFEEDSCKAELFTLRCESEQARFLESQLLQNIRAKELIGDDKVVPCCIDIPVKIDAKLFGITQRRTVAAEGLGFHDEPVLTDLSEDFEKLAPSVFSLDEAYTGGMERYAEETLGDILPPRRVNTLNRWHFTPTQHAVNLMGMENMFLAMYDTPEEFKAMMQFFAEDFRRLLRWEEENGVLFANAGNDYMGSGSYCFNGELAQDGAVASRQTWGHMNSQETVGVNPEMYGEFVFPCYEQTAKEFGLLYYGCCEPVHPIWDEYLSKIPNLRKVSISPWCDEAFMAERLAGGRVIYSRKPSPNFLGVMPELDEDAFTASIKNTLSLTRDCHIEFIFRDVYTLHANPAKARRAVEIVRGLL